MKKNRIPDKIPHTFFLSIVIVTIILILVVIGFIFFRAYPTIESTGLINFITGDKWHYGEQVYGIRRYLVGTLIVTLVTLIFAVPIGIFTAIFLSEFSSPRLTSLIRPLIELLVGIPSVVYGIFGLLILEPILRNVDPIISNTFFFIPFFHEVTPGRGNGVFLASLVLSVMILPTIITITEDSIRAVANEYREASFSLGATQWETIRHIILPAASGGIVSAIVLGMMRAAGETMAVVMLVGGADVIPNSIFSYTASITGKILVDSLEFIDQPGPGSAIFALAASLFTIEIFLAGILRILMRRSLNKNQLTGP